MTRKQSEIPHAPAAGTADGRRGYPLIVCETMGEWLAKRRKLGVGSSEVAALFTKPGDRLKGMSYYESYPSLNYKKRGLAFMEPEEEADPADLEWRRVEAEEAVAQWFARVVVPEIKGARGITDPGPFTLCAHPALPLFSTVDRLIDFGDAPALPLEVKNAYGFNARAWGNEPPIGYQLQVQAQLMVFGAPHGYLCASVGGNLPRWAKITADPKMQTIIAGRVTKFWREVTEGVEPEMDGHRKTAAALLSRYPDDDGGTITLSAGAAHAWQRRELLRSYRNRAQLRYDAYTNAVRAEIGDATYGELPNGRKVAYKTGADGRRRFKEMEA